jgi:hypothetical protein
MALGMLQESPVDEEDGSSCRRASNLNHNTVLSLALLLIVFVVVRLILGACNPPRPHPRRHACAHTRGSGSAKRAIGSHDIRGEVDALVEDS